MTTPRTRRSAFTLIELLVVVAIIAILLLLLLPAINAVREMSRRAHCMNNQRSLAVAMINYESAHRAFPAAVALCDSRVTNSLGREAQVACMGPNWASVLLGMLDEQNRFEKLFSCLVVQWHASDDCPTQDGAIGTETPTYMLCPSAPTIQYTHTSPQSQLERLSKSNYAACLGSAHYRSAIEASRRSPQDVVPPTAGALAVVPIPHYAELVELTRAGKRSGEWKIAHGVGVTTPRISDGTSKTVVLSEILPWDAPAVNSPYSQDIRGVWVSPSMGASTYTHKFGPNSRMPDRINACDPDIPRDHPLFCEQTAPFGDEAAETWASARSAHRQGVVTAWADGSVKFVTDDIFLPIWHAMATRAGGER